MGLLTKEEREALLNFPKNEETHSWEIKWTRVHRRPFAKDRFTTFSIYCQTHKVAMITMKELIDNADITDLRIIEHKVA